MNAHENATALDPEEARRRRTCPHCGVKLSAWEVPQTPFTEVASEHVYVCSNDDCSYFREGCEVMARQGGAGLSYRLMLNPDNESFMPIAVPARGVPGRAVAED